MAISTVNQKGLDAPLTLTSPTLTSPVISTITNGAATITLPTTTGTAALTNNAGLSLVKVAGGTLSAASAITVDGCFTSTYVNYVIYVNASNFTGSADTDVFMQFRAGGSTNSSAAYPYSVNYINAGVNAGTASSNSGSATSWLVYDNMDSGSIFNGTIQVFSPQIASKTTTQWFLYGEDNSNFKQMLGFGFQSQATSFDGFTLTMSSGTLTGTYDIYGIAR